jgi:hypothetical protein
MKPKNLYRIMIGVLMVISGIISIIMTVGNPIVGTILVCAGLAFLFTGIVRHRKFGDDPESDERSKKIGAYGLSYAWLTGLFFMVALLWLDNLGLLKLSTVNALSCSILVLTISAVIYQAYLFRKGDVE